MLLLRIEACKMFFWNSGAMELILKTITECIFIMTWNTNLSRSYTRACKNRKYHRVNDFSTAVMYAAKHTEAVSFTKLATRYKHAKGNKWKNYQIVTGKLIIREINELHDISHVKHTWAASLAAFLVQRAIFSCLARTLTTAPHISSP